jgi:hypothetical protein
MDERVVRRGGASGACGWPPRDVALKRAELARFDAEVSEWEQREYFDLF